MTQVAFYAPMKAPTHPTPSGDREMARNLIAMIGQNDATVNLVSELRLHEKAGDPLAQIEIRKQAAAEAHRLIRDLPETDLWVSYHNYYKAPDLIGPAVCAARQIPYVQIESTRAKKRLTGPWAGFAQAAHDACDAAQLVFHLTGQDHFALNRDKPATQLLAPLPPFLPTDTLPPASDLDGPILSVGMMREGDKLASYKIIAETLGQTPGDWRLEIAGDGPAEPQVRALMAPYGHRVTYLGRLDQDTLSHAYRRAGLFLWPGVNEAFGMVYLEAQAHGLPVVAQNRPGVRDVLAPGSYPALKQGESALAGEISRLLADPKLRQYRGRTARDYIKANHLIGSASLRFWSAVTPLLEAPS
ncbi:glycosyltransferase family 4 protein [Aliisedimentitalea scapharcae]|uniref:Glycosyltransferase family 4 protein n=1 Tax=Aliisedimentitalea scapharcae TaxID=1524259 RepID=A0ABZ2XXT7_9RHOB